MKRIVYAVLATISGLVLLFSYRTSLEVVTPQAASSTTGTDASTSGSGGDSGSSDTSSGTDPGSSSGTDSGVTDSGSTDSGATDPGSSGSTGSSDSTGTSDSSGSAGASSTGLVDGSYTGTSAGTRFGPVQVQITVSGGQITAAQAVDYPTENRRDQQINQIAIPRLVSETLAAQSADIDMISGATYTSDGYIQSLQSAIDQATS